MIKLNNLSVDFNGRLVLDNADFYVNSGQFVVIKGESGCGKTTLLRILMDLIKYEGNYYYNNELVCKDDIMRNYYYVPQDVLLIQDMSVRNHFHMITNNFTCDYFLNVVSRLDISELMNKYPNQLSEGERKRVAIALAIVSKKGILILDEPTSSLNEEYSYVVGELLREYTEHGYTVISSSHDLILNNYADYVFMIEKGKIIALKENKIVKTSERISQNLNICFNLNKILDIVKTRLLRKKVASLFQMILLSITAILLVFNNGAIKVHTDNVNNISSTEVLMYNSVDGQGLLDYTYEGSEYPLSEQLTKGIMEINHLTSINYRFDCLLNNSIDQNGKLSPDTRSIENILTQMKIIVDGEYTPINIQNNNIGTGIDITQTNFYQRNYDNRINYDERIEKKLSNEQGIYLSKSFFNLLFKDVKEYNNLSLYFPLNVPVYDCDGISSIEADYFSGEYRANAVATKIVWMELPILGVLKDNSLYDINASDVDYILFVPNDLLNEYIEKENKTDTIIKYFVLNDNKFDTYLNVLPDSYVGELKQTITFTPWKPNCYVANVDSLGNLNTVLNQINGIGLNAKNIYINASSLKDSINSIQKATRKVGLGIIIILLSITFSSKKKEYFLQTEINEFFKNIGMSMKFIIEIKRKLYLTTFFIYSLLVGLLSFFFVHLLNIIFFSNTKFSFVLCLIIICLTCLSEFVFPIYIESKWYKDVKN